MTSLTETPKPFGTPVLAPLRAKSGWIIALGVIYIVAGLIALASIVEATVVSVFIVGIMMLIAGVAEVIHAFQVKSWGKFLLWAVLGALYIVAGFVTFENPLLAAAILTLVGAVDLPIIKFSVDWWNTLHQGSSVFRLGGSTIYPTILIPLLVMALAFTLLFATLHLAAMRNEILRRRVRTLRLIQASAAS